MIRNLLILILVFDNNLDIGDNKETGKEIYLFLLINLPFSI